MPDKAKAISVAQLSSAAHNAAQTALKQSKNLQALQPEPGIVVRPPWIIGIVFRDADLANLGEYTQLATTIAGQIQGQAGAVTAAATTTPIPALYISGHTILTGYRPAPEDIHTLE